MKRGKRVIQHWQARQISIEADPPQPVQVAAEMAGDTPVSAGIMLGAARRCGTILPLDRFNTFSDGVFAIAITILVLELGDPSLSIPLPEALREL